MFEKFTFRPEHQPDPEKPVEFELKPLDNAGLFRLVKSYAISGHPEWDDLCVVLDRNVVGWSGLPLEYAQAGKRDLLLGEGNFNLIMWLGECARELYNRATPKEAARKNS